MVFVRYSPEHDNGWVEYLEDLNAQHFVVNGFEMPVRAPMEIVIDNAFDQAHFHAIHRVRAEHFAVSRSAQGALIIEGVMHVPDARKGRGTTMPAAYRGFIVSPGLAAVELRAIPPYTVITGATDLPTGGCVIRISLAFPKAEWTTPPPPSVYEPLLQHSHRGLEADRTVWENLSTSSQPRWMPQDYPSQEFLEFCNLHRDYHE
jgi:hypothetical protein